MNLIGKVLGKETVRINFICKGQTYFETESFVTIECPYLGAVLLRNLELKLLPLGHKTLTVKLQTCFNCNVMVESESDVLLSCRLYRNIQSDICFQSSFLFLK